MTLDVKLIRHNAVQVNNPDDPSYPFVMDATLRPPEFMIVAFVGLYGGSEIIRVRGKTRHDIVEFVKTNDLARHVRLRRLTITDETTNEMLFEVEHSKPPAPELFK
jgi:hypothetical protein